jgi:hypothetical protein
MYEDEVLDQLTFFSNSTRDRLSVYAIPTQVVKMAEIGDKYRDTK